MVENYWCHKRVLITGVCGTVGKELLRQVSQYAPAEIVGLDNNESELFFLGQEYRQHQYVNLFLGDIRDRDKLHRKMAGIDIVIHAAALKHVILCEQSPRDAVLTNIIGIQNVIDAAVHNGVKKVLFTSSDKAVNPTNVMGTSKLMGERMMTAANAYQRSQQTIFISTRFGNVLGSRGSVIPLFRRQIAAGGPVTITDNRMTRFIMTLEQAVKMVLDSALIGRGGEVFVTKMPVIRIADLASIMIEELAGRYGRDPKDIELQTIGSKPGEKFYEELLSDEETRRSIELEDYFVVLPAFKSVYSMIDYDYPSTVSSSIDRPYNSSLEQPMEIEQLRRFLKSENLLFQEE